MRVLVALTYFRPHVSGLTIYVERLAAALIERGHEVTVLTSQHDPSLPREEDSGGVKIIRVPVALKVSKGALMPTLGYWATKLARTHDVLSLHLPQFDAAGIALRGRLFNRPTVLTYHCDLQLPAGAFNRAVDQAVFVANYLSGVEADRIVAYTDDYANHSRFLRKFKHKIVVIPPPVVMPSPSADEVAAFKAAHDLDGRPVIAYASRFATEKGIEYLVDAMPTLLKSFSDLKVLFAGPYRDVIGEEEYRARLEPRIAELGHHWEFLGTLKPHQLPPFYGALDSLIMSSVNSTESFGLVQVEAMLCGTPVVTSDLPGVRQPVKTTGMGVIVPVANAPALAQGVIEVLSNHDRYVRPRAEVEQAFDIDVTVTAYEQLFADLIAQKQRR